eukprot:7707451-Alexandrium_andersonii.AAC.1
MSASLVGSEMCIRDRHRSPQPTHAHQTHNQHPATSSTSPPHRPTPLYHCLLYTSDAADDM